MITYCRLEADRSFKTNQLVHCMHAPLNLCTNTHLWSYDKLVWRKVQVIAAMHNRHTVKSCASNVESDVICSVIIVNQTNVSDCVWCTWIQRCTYGACRCSPLSPASKQNRVSKNRSADIDTHGWKQHLHMSKAVEVALPALRRGNLMDKPFNEILVSRSIPIRTIVRLTETIQRFHVIETSYVMGIYPSLNFKQ